jgi:transglutaminase-like putative cysteine protease
VITQISHDGKAIAFVYYLFAFMLLWEWLRPLQEFTDTANTFIFVFFIGISFLLVFFKSRWYVAFPVKISIILFMLHGLYFEGVFFSFLWVRELVQDIVFNINLIPGANWVNMTSSFRSFLFFILLWLLVYLIHYWILFQKRILVFFVLTLLYITVLDTFTPYDATFAIVRTVLIGFFMLGLLYFDRLKKIENLKVKGMASFRWILPLFAFIFMSMFLAFLAPKASPQWPDPVPYITAIGRENEDEAGLKKIGYSQNDEKLGGGFIGDDTEVFTHVSTDRHYWRIETKDVYTGKGWEVSDPEASLEELNSFEELKWTDDRVETKSLESTITINESYRHLHVMYPLGLTSIQTDNNMGFYFNRNTELITPFQEGEGSRAEFITYEVGYELPSYPLNEMRKEQRFTNVPEGFIERYTQLPDSLPSRVRDLAVQITANANNQFDQAKAIENYLGSVEFTYDKEEVAIPKEGQDYVDQFLFETLKGYCDNFSTSMIVLLRSVDIPARWVKGYTEGDFINNVTSTEKEYQVTNNNAHSWVEIYFDGVGWVPFEPTKGFVNPYDLTFDYKNTDVEQDQIEEEDSSTEKEEQEQKQTPEKPEKEEQESTAPTDNKGFSLFNFQLGSVSLYSMLLFILLLGFAIYKTRMKWLPKFIINKYKKRTDDEVFFQAYESLLKQFDRYGIKRKESQTLREYAHYIDGYFNIVHMTALTKNYEKALYRRDNAKEEWQRSVELWENLIKRTSS